MPFEICPCRRSGEDRERRLKFTQREWLSAIRDQPEAATWFAELTTAAELGPLPNIQTFSLTVEARSASVLRL